MKTFIKRNVLPLAFIVLGGLSVSLSAHAENKTHEIYLNLQGENYSLSKYPSLGVHMGMLNEPTSEMSPSDNPKYRFVMPDNKDAITALGLQHMPGKLGSFTVPLSCNLKLSTDGKTITVSELSSGKGISKSSAYFDCHVVSNKYPNITVAISYYPEELGKAVN